MNARVSMLLGVGLGCALAAWRSLPAADAFTPPAHNNWDILSMETNAPQLYVLAGNHTNCYSKIFEVAAEAHSTTGTIKTMYLDWSAGLPGVAMTQKIDYLLSDLKIVEWTNRSSLHTVPMRGEGAPAVFNLVTDTNQTGAYGMQNYDGSLTFTGTGKDLVRNVVLTNDNTEGGHILGAKAELDLPNSPVTDNFPVEGIGLRVIPSVMAGAFRIESMNNLPTDPDRSNVLGTDVMAFEKDTNDIWRIKKAIWYGTGANNQGERPPGQSWGSRWMDGTGKHAPEYHAPHELVATVKGPGDIACEIRAALTVKLTDRANANCEISVLGTTIARSGGSWHIQLPPPEAPFLEVVITLKTDGAVSQYRDMVVMEEKVHGNQYAGWNKYEVEGWDPEQQFHLGEYWKHAWWRTEFLRYLTTCPLTPGVYDEANNRVVFQGASQRAVRAVHENGQIQLNAVTGSKGAFFQIASPMMEKTAKEFVGFGEAYRYKDTYMRPPGNYPENPEQPQLPPQ